jgi:cyclophilin family peptidyl-prolyl cis-trans isomerase
MDIDNLNDEESEYIYIKELPAGPPQLLRVPTGWKVFTNGFCDLDPNTLDPDDELWANFDYETIILEHDKSDTKLDLGWRTLNDPSGYFLLGFIEGNYDGGHAVLKTRDKNEVVRIMEDHMLQTSIKSGEHTSNESLKLQPIDIHTRWAVVHNQFFENEDLNLLTESLLKLETYSGQYQLHMGWYPAHDPNGQFFIRAGKTNELDNPLVYVEIADRDTLIKAMNKIQLELHEYKPGQFTLDSL